MERTSTILQRTSSHPNRPNKSEHKYNHIRIHKGKIGSQPSFCITNSNFLDLMSNSSAIIDKSNFISRLLNLECDRPSIHHQAHLITSPRRTGKTTLLAMLQFFLEIPLSEFLDGDFAKLVKKLKVSKQTRHSQCSNLYTIKDSIENYENLISKRSQLKRGQLDDLLLVELALWNAATENSYSGLSEQSTSRSSNGKGLG